MPSAVIESTLSKKTMNPPGLNEHYRGTETMRSGLEIDPGSVQRFFEDRIEGFDGEARICQFRGGQSNPSYRVDSGSCSWVIRRKPPGLLLPSAHAVDREFRVLKALAKTDVPVPKTNIICMDESVLGTAFYVMDYVEGPVYWEALLPDKTPAERRLIYDAMNEGIARLHKADYLKLELEDFGRPGNYVQRQLKRWGKQYLEADFKRIPEMDLLIEWLGERIPEQESTSIVHGDYRLDNMIFHPKEPRVLAILDWELCTLGDPFADLAYHVMQWRIPLELHRGLAGTDLDSLGIPNEKEYVAAYCRRTGREEIPNWEIYMIFSMFKLGAIFYGILVRQHLGTSVSEHAASTGAIAGPMAKLGWKEVQKQGLD